MKSISCKDSSGLSVEFVLKSPRDEELFKEERSKARSNLDEWMAKAA